jgi:hypothetical protein
MKEVVIPTKYEIEPPILIDSDRIKELDELLSTIQAGLEGERWERIFRFIETNDSAKKYYGDITTDNIREIIAEKEFSLIPWKLERSSVEITLFLSNNQYLAVDSLAECFNNIHLQNRNVEKLEIKIAIGEVEIEIRQSYSNKLVIDVSPPGLEVSKDAFGKLRYWASQVELPLIQKLLYSRKWLIAGLVIYPIFILAPIAVGSINNGTREINNEAIKLLKAGIDETNYLEALEILLALNVKYHPNIPVSRPDTLINVIKALLFLLPGLGLLLFVSPKFVIAFGNGVNRIRYWRIWLRFIWITVPIYIFGTIFLPKISNWLSAILSF